MPTTLHAVSSGCASSGEGTRASAMEPRVVASPMSAMVTMVARPPGTANSPGTAAPPDNGIALANSETNGSITATTIMLIKTS